MNRRHYFAPGAIVAYRRRNRVAKTLRALIAWLLSPSFR